MTSHPGIDERTKVLRPLINAVRNGSRVPLAPDAIPAILAGGSAEPSHLQALFGDSSLAALERAAAACGIDLGRVLDAYAAARVAAAAANPELDAALAERAAWRRG